MDFLFPDSMSLFLFLLLMITAGFTSFISAAFGAGGGLMLLVVMASFMPMAVVVPVHGLVQLGSNANRLLLSFKHIDKSMFVYFALGGLVGAGLSSFVIDDISLDAMKLVVAIFVICLLWGKTPPIKLTSKVWRMVAGGITTFISMFVGASGPLVGSCLYINNYEKLKFTATFSSIMSLQHLLKAIIYGAVGFSFWQWIPLVIAMVISGAVGTWLGIKLLKSMSGDKFKRIFRIVLTLLTLQLGWQGVKVLLH